MSTSNQGAEEILSGLDLEPQKKYVLQDIMKKRRKDQQTIMNKLRNKQQLKNKRKSKADLIQSPEKFIKEYRAQQKSYAKYRQQNRKIHGGRFKPHNKPSNSNPNNKLILAIRIRGVKDISKQQKLILNKLGLRQVNTAVFLKSTVKTQTMLKTIENYITWGQPNKKIISELIYKKAYGKINNQRVQIKSNEMIEKQIGGQVLCFEDMINEIYSTGKQFKQIRDFIYPFKLSTPEGLLVSRLRKPIRNDGHWGYRGEDINEYIEAMI